MNKTTVLVVDDSPLIRQVVTDAFQPMGFAVVAAADGSEALRRIHESSPDIIVADILMPVMDGWRLCEEVRRTPETADIPFIFLTTEKEAAKRLRGFRLGADDYITKPFAQEELVARAERLLTRIQRMRELSTNVDRLSGHTKHLSMADLLQILSLNGRTGTLRLTSDDGGEGRIYFRDGRIIHADMPGVEGEKALFRLMMWAESRFVFEDLPPSITETIRGATSSVLMDGFTHWDELRHLGDSLPGRSWHYSVHARVEGFIEHIDLGEAERDTLTGVKEGLSTGEILDTLPHRDLDIYRAILGMLEKGFIERVEAEMDTQPVQRSKGSS